MENGANDEKLIRQMVENWARAVRDRDMAAILAHHTDDIIMFDVPKPFQSVGIDAYRDTWDMFFKDTKPGVFDIDTLEVIADEHVAFCIVTMRCSTKNADGDYEPLPFRLTTGLRKIDDQWMIVHEHHSIPAE